MAYTKPTIARKTISRDDAKLLIVSAAIFRDPDEVIAYHRDGSNGVLYKAYSLPLPLSTEWVADSDGSEEALLEYARNNIPDELHF